MNIRDAVNDPDFNISGLNADNFERRLKLRLSEIDTEERRAPKIISEYDKLETYEDARKMIGEILFQKRAV